MSIWNRYIHVTASVARLSCAAAVGCALASGAHLLALSPDTFNALAELTTQEGKASEDDGISPEMLEGSSAIERYTRPIAFAPCAENPALDCGTLTVPVDYRKPYGKTVGIGVIRARATNLAKRIGVVIGNPGGAWPLGSRLRVGDRAPAG